ncbi:hypothetical protein B0H19DRAFT_136910 [Mycena capillaripes]|nr:hypothetical protein B0H19DRAFT_136910 [Mycena capillaripes]
MPTAEEHPQIGDEPSVHDAGSGEYSASAESDDSPAAVGTTGADDPPLAGSAGPRATLPDVVRRLMDIQARFHHIERFFGIQKASSFASQVHQADDYEWKYEPDVQYEETSASARVWRVYMDESAILDLDMIGGMRDALDVLLVFAALFSAVITTFVSQTSQQLSPDYTEITASLVFQSVQIQLAILNGTDRDFISPSLLTPLTPFSADLATVWVNGLWFVSLTLSLVTAFAAVLVKQWLHQYMRLPSGSVRDRALTRQFRFMGFEQWYVAWIVGSLPVIVHASVGLFLAGLAVFLTPLQHSIATIVTVIGVLVLALYLVANFLPVIAPSCSYRTPVGDAVYRILPKAKALLNLALRHIHPDNFSAQSITPMSTTLNALERSTVEKNSRLHVEFSSNFSVRNIAAQAIADLPDFRVIELPKLPLRNLVQPDLDRAFQELKKIMEHDTDLQPAERLLRSMVAAEWRSPPFFGSKFIWDKAGLFSVSGALALAADSKSGYPQMQGCDSRQHSRQTVALLATLCVEATGKGSVLDEFAISIH